MKRRACTEGALAPGPGHPAAVAGSSPMLKFGKHKGRTFADVLASDPGYCAWVLREKAPSTGLKGFRKYLSVTAGGILEVGKHKGRSYEQVLQDDPCYGEWAVTLKDASGSLKSFAEYISNRPTASGERGAKRQKAAGHAEAECKVCMGHEVNACLVPCGHTMCLKCALRFEDKACPICREHVALVVQTFAP